MANTPDPAVSTKGLDDLGKKFLFGESPADKDEYIMHQGQNATTEAIEKYEKERLEEFQKRAGHFTEDLVAFIMEQRSVRGLSDIETIFGLALTNINLRHAYGSPQGSEAKLDEEEQTILLAKFDGICWSAQQYWDAHTESNTPDGS